MKYFKFFPKIQYDLDANGQTRQIVDTFRFAKLVTEFKDDITFYRFYDIQEGERPDHVSQKLYNTPIYYWTFFLCNANMKSLENDWPVPSNDLQDKIKHTYIHTILRVDTFDFFNKFTVGETLQGLISGATAKFVSKSTDLGVIRVLNVTGTFQGNEIVQGQTSGDTTIISGQQTEVNSPHHYEKDGFQVPRSTDGRSEVSILQYERDQNDKNKKIKVIRPELISKVAKQFRSVVSG